MTSYRSVILIAISLIGGLYSARADEIRRFVEMSFVCGRDSAGRVLFSQDSQKHSYEITSWSDPFTENICHKRSDLPQGCIPTELYDFSFRCGSGGSVHISNFYLNSRSGKNFGAHREGDHIVLNGGQQRVLTSHRYGDCFGKGLSLTDMSRCIESADQYRIDQIRINLPAGRAPLPNEAKLATKVVGDDCGNGLYCNAGNKCSFGGGCIPVASVDCGSGRSCPSGTTCGANNSCLKPAASPGTAEGAPPPPGGSGLHIEANSVLAVGAGVIFVAFFSWIFGSASKLLPPKRSSFLRQVAVESTSAIISGIVLYQFGIVDEIKLLTIPLFGGLSVALITTIKTS